MDCVDAWFANEILPHEADLMSYLARVWPNRTEIPDLRQEVYVRIYERVARGFPRTPRAFMFVTARNLVTDRLRRERIVSIDYTQNVELLDGLVDEISPEQSTSARQELRRMAKALDDLSDNCRSVIWLRRVEGLSQRETAQRLGMHEGAVEGYVSRGLRALAQATNE
jgi:RNA polymerase sigma factor (sigma-70 family)